MSPHTSTSFNTPIRRCLAIAGVTLAALSAPSFARAEEFVNMIRYFDSNGVAHYVGSLDQVPPEYRASAKVPDADLRMPPVTSVGNDRSGRQTWEVEYKRRREEREKQIQKMDQEFRDLQQREAGRRPSPPRARAFVSSTSARSDCKKVTTPRTSETTSTRDGSAASGRSGSSTRIARATGSRTGSAGPTTKRPRERRRRSPSPDAARSNEPALTRLASS